MGIEGNGKLCASPAALLPERSCGRSRRTPSALSVPILSSQVYLPVWEGPAATRAQGLEDAQESFCLLVHLANSEVPVY